MNSIHRLVNLLISKRIDVEILAYVYRRECGESCFAIRLLAEAWNKLNEARNRLQGNDTLLGPVLYHHPLDTVHVDPSLRVATRL